MQHHRLFHTSLLTAIVCSLTLVALLFVASARWLASQPVPTPLLPLLTPQASIPPRLFLTYREQLFATDSATLLPDKQTIRFGHALHTRFVRTPPPPFDEQKIRSWLHSIAPMVHVEASPSALIVTNNAKQPLTIYPGQRGRYIDENETILAVQTLSSTATSSAPLVITETGDVLTPDGIITTERRLQKLLGKKIVLTASDTKKTLVPADLARILELPTGYNKDGVQKFLEEWNRSSIQKNPIEPELEIDGKLVKKFVAPRDGEGLDLAKATEELIRSLEATETEEAIEKTIALPITTVPPTKTLALLNNLGISERIGVGTSAYVGSIPNRIHNVALTTSKIHGHIVMPGEEFSFNIALGDVSAATGFKQAYIIRDGQTILGDGGGVCQVSSTLFRAILNAGLPVSARRGHSYRVGYYEQNSRPGFDATVYAPSPDLKFINDTSNAILINAVANSKTATMYIEIWGKRDGRKAEIKNYRKWDEVRPPPAEYKDDPSLPPGKVVQVEHAAWGLKTSFDYVVTYPDGQVKEKKFNTNYIPWKAVYLRGV